MSFYRQSAKNLIFQIINLGPFLTQITTGEAYLVHTNRLRSNSPFNQYLSALYKVVGTYLFGAAISQSLTDLAKFTIGRPRPNFIDVCKPVVCHGYMLEIKCNGTARNVTESRWTLYNTYQICYRVQCKELKANGWWWIFIPLDVWAPQPISKAEPSHCTEETHFGSLYYSLSHYRDFILAGKQMDW